MLSFVCYSPHFHDGAINQWQLKRKITSKKQQPHPVGETNLIWFKSPQNTTSQLKNIWVRQNWNVLYQVNSKSQKYVRSMKFSICFQKFISQLVKTDLPHFIFLKWKNCFTIFLHLFYRTGIISTDFSKSSKRYYEALLGTTS